MTIYQDIAIFVLTTTTTMTTTTMLHDRLLYPLAHARGVKSGGGGGAKAPRAPPVYTLAMVEH